jgi:ribosomal protein L37E
MTKTEKFILKAKKIHGDVYDYSMVEYLNNTTPVIIGHNGSFYEVTPSNHLKGSKLERMKNRYDLKKFIDVSNKVHNFKYDYSQTNLTILKNKIKIICPKHGLFVQISKYHLDGHGCLRCGRESSSSKIRIPSEELIKTIHEKWGEYFKYINLSNDITKETVLKIVCPKHGFFEKLVLNHLKYGCKECAYESISKKTKFTKDEIIYKFNKKWNNYYDYSKFEYISYNEKSIIICPKHGDFSQTPQIHLKSGCSKCGYENVSTLRRYSLEQFIERAKLLHGDQYDYSKVKYKNSRNLILIICPVHGEFKQKAGSHLMGYGCKSCCESKGEKLIRVLLETHKIDFIREKVFEGCVSKISLPFDFYLPKFDMIIEFDGIQHFKPMDFFGGQKSFELNKTRDQIKNVWCENNNIKLIRISYKEMNKIEEILKKELNLYDKGKIS